MGFEVAHIILKTNSTYIYIFKINLALSRWVRKSSRVNRHTRTRDLPASHVLGDTCTLAQSPGTRGNPATCSPPPRPHYQWSGRESERRFRDEELTCCCPSSQPVPTHNGGSGGLQDPDSQVAWICFAM